MDFSILNRGSGVRGTHSVDVLLPWDKLQAQDCA